jgi:hypothetical protein
MWKAALAGAVALAMVDSFSVSHNGFGFGVASASAEEVMVTEAQIGRLHAALHLTPTQEHHWYAVAAILRSLGHHQQQYQVASNDAGFVERAHARVSGYMVTAVAMQRLRSAAEPLIAVLSDEQKSSGRDVLQSMGMSF